MDLPEFNFYDATSKPSSQYSLQVDTDFVTAFFAQTSDFVLLADFLGKCNFFPKDKGVSALNRTVYTRKLFHLNLLFLRVPKGSNSFVAVGNDPIPNSNHFETIVKFFVLPVRSAFELELIGQLKLFTSADATVLTPVMLKCDHQLTKLALVFDNKQITLFENIFFTENKKVECETTSFKHHMPDDLFFTEVGLVFKFSNRLVLVTPTKGLEKKPMFVENEIFSGETIIQVIDDETRLFVFCKEQLFVFVKSELSKYTPAAKQFLVSGTLRAVSTSNDRLFLVTETNKQLFCSVTDLTHSFLLFRKPVPFVVGPIYVVTDSSFGFMILDSKLFFLYCGKLRPITKRVQTLVKSRRFDLALAVLATEAANMSATENKQLSAQTRMQLGNSLYEQENFSAALDEYICAVKTDSSLNLEVLEVFYRDKQTDYTIMFLVELHKAKLVSPEHSLLLSVYLVKKDDENSFLHFLQAGLFEYQNSEDERRLLYNRMTQVLCANNAMEKAALELARKANNLLAQIRLLVRDADFAVVLSLFEQCCESDFLAALDFVPKQVLSSSTTDVLSTFHRKLLVGTVSPIAFVPTLQKLKVFESVKVGADLQFLFKEVFVSVSKVGKKMRCSYTPFVLLHAYFVLAKKHGWPVDEPVCEKLVSKCGDVDFSATVDICRKTGCFHPLKSLYLAKGLLEELLLQLVAEKAPLDHFVDIAMQLEKQKPEVWQVLFETVVLQPGAFFATNSFKFSAKTFLELVVEKTVATNTESICSVLGKLAKNNRLDKKLVSGLLVTFHNKLSHESNSLTNVLDLLATKSKLLKEAITKKSTLSVLQLANCAICETKLEYPVKFYFCGHSYHLSCLLGNEEGVDGNAEKTSEETRCFLCMIEFQKRKSSLVQPSLVSTSNTSYALLAEKVDDRLKDFID